MQLKAFQKVNRAGWFVLVSGLILLASTFLAERQTGGYLAQLASGVGAKSLGQLELLQSSWRVVLVLSNLLGIWALFLFFHLRKTMDYLKTYEGSCQDIRIVLEPENLAVYDSHDALVKALKFSADKITLCLSETRLELSEAKKRTRAVIEKAVDVICVIDVQSRFVSVSQACHPAWGYEPKELEARPITDIIVNDDTDRVLKSILGAAKSIARVSFECKLRKKSGELIDVVWSAYWSASDSGLFSIIHDITVRKEAEELVKRSEAKLRLTLENLPAGVLLLSPLAGQIEFVNSEALRLFNFDSEQALALGITDIFEELETIQDAESHEPQAAEHSKPVAVNAKRQDGSKFPVEVSLSKIEIAGEEKQIVVFIDKTEQQELERLKTEFMAMVIHDVRSPLTGIMCMLDLLDCGSLELLSEERARRIINGGKNNIEQVIRLICDLLDLEKARSGKFELECNNMSMGNAVQLAAESMTHVANVRGLKFELTVSECPCWGDKERLIQVLVNLFANAIKYSPDDETISVVTLDLPESVKVMVSDRGRGVPPNKITKIFEKFEQVEASDAKEKGGQGLGLAICKLIVDEHGGEIGVDSEPGKGSCFWFAISKRERMTSQ